MPAGMRRLDGSGVGSYGVPAGDSPATARNGDIIEILDEADAPIIEVVEPIAGAGGGAPTDIDVTNPAYSPVGVPVVLVRSPDGILRADADPLIIRPTRDEVTAAITAAARKQSYRHTQAIPAQTWLIFHDLPFIPAGVAVEGEQGQRIWPLAVVHPAIGRTRIEFTRPVAGAVDLS